MKNNSDKIGYAIQLVLNILEVGNLGLGLFEVEAVGVVAIELFDGGSLRVAVFEVFVVVQVAIVGRDGIEVAHVDCFCGFFLG